MKLFSSTQMSWSEPYFFVIRLRERAGWLRRGLLFFGVFLVMFLAMYFMRPQFGTLKAVALGLACGAVIVLLADIGNLQREVTINEDCIMYNSAVQQGIYWMGSFKLPDIRQVNLMRPEDWGKSCGAMLVQTAADSFLLGVPNKISLDTVANVLHRLKVPVTLRGWEPSETDTRVQVKEEIVLADEKTRQAAKARIWPVDESEGKLNPTSTTVVAVVIGLGPLILALIGLIAAIVYLIMKWSTLAALDKWLIGGGAFAALVLAFVYLILAGQFLASRYQISVGKSVLRMRPNSRFSGVEDFDLIPVEIYDRTAWTSVMSKSIDFGFLHIDPASRSLSFEGDKNRWDIPLAALTTCRIEEAHVGSEGNENAEKRYYVLIACDNNGESWEAGMIHVRTAMGNDGKEARYARAQGLFRRISDVVSPT